MIKSQVEDNTVMLYMKGTPAQPQCGFSQQVCRILHATGTFFRSAVLLSRRRPCYVGVEFASVNVLEDDTLREGIKQFSERVLPSDCSLSTPQSSKSPSPPQVADDPPALRRR